MRALAVVPGSTTLGFVERPEPQISAPDDVKVKILRVGICGTDREEAAGGRSKAPDGQTDLVIGHEMFGQVVAVGQAVTRVKPGDYAVFTVRRGCGKCTPCQMNRSDMCETGEYHERGIWGLDGYQTEFAVDKESYIVRVPDALKGLGVLAEPTSVAEKAIEEAVRVQTSRLPDALVSPNWLFGRRCLVAGLGPIGLVAAFILVLRGAEVYGMDVVDATSARPLEFNLLDALSTNGVYVLTGIPGGDHPVQLSGAELIRRLVLYNQVMLGSVNASRAHFQMAVDDLNSAYLRWGDHMAGLITDIFPPDNFEQALEHHDVAEIKVVLEWGKVS